MFAGRVAAIISLQVSETRHRRMAGLTPLSRNTSSSSMPLEEHFAYRETVHFFHLQRVIAVELVAVDISMGGKRAFRLQSPKKLVK